jgi:hypothetical protein
MAVLYLAFTANVGWRELIASALAGMLSAASAIIFAHAGKVKFSFRIRDVLQAWRIPQNVVSGTIEVLRALATQLFTARGADSAVRAVRFDMGDKDDPRDAGRRAMAITYTTATPNFIIMGMVDQQQLMLYHQIVPGKVRKMTRNLGARP